MTPIPTTPQPLRFAIAALVFAVLFGGVAWRLHTLQMDMGEILSDMGERQRSRKWVLAAERGRLVDAKGTPLVESLSTWKVTCDPRYMEDRLGATIALADILGLPRDELRTHFESRRNGRVIARGLDDALADRIRACKFTGVRLEREFTRTYHHGGLAAHLLGYVQADGKGGAGLELQFDSVLAGKPGEELTAVDALGRPVVTGFDHQAPQSGAHLQLSLDLGVQRILDQHLAAAVDKHAPKGACGLVVRPATGEILAMASWPDYQPQTRQGLEGDALRNNVIGFSYEPGSTMKPLITGAAVAEKLARFEERIDCERGAWTYREGRAARTIHEKTGGHGLLSVAQGIALSDNIMMAKLGVRLGPERLKSWVERLSFGRRTGICLPGEETGRLPAGNRGQWSNINEGMSVPMGHALMVTPLQLAMAHAAVANGGQWNPPRLVKRIWRHDQDGKVEELPLPALPATVRMFEPEDAAAIQQAMTMTMTEGTGKRVGLDGYTSAGKTGTAEKVIDGRYASDHNVGSFVCWAPAEPGMRPELLCLVVVDDPSRNGRFGADTAAPVVQKVLQESLEHLRVPKRPEAVAEDGKPVKPGKPARQAGPVPPTAVPPRAPGRAAGTLALAGHRSQP